jgi:hypothetical protein
MMDQLFKCQKCYEWLREENLIDTENSRVCVQCRHQENQMYHLNTMTNQGVNVRHYDWR